jgi:signal peptidase II
VSVECFSSRQSEPSYAFSQLSTLNSVPAKLKNVMDHDSVAQRATSRFQPNPLFRRAIAIAALVVVLDQIVKQIIEQTIGPGSDRFDYWLAGDWLGFEYVRNSGVAFGLQFGNSSLTIAVALAVFVLIGWSFWKMAGHSRVAVVGIGLLAGGGLGNIIDRIRYDSVIDFVAIGPWPRFNIADSAITIGVLLLAWSVLFAPVEASNAPTKEQTPHAATRSEQ